MAVPPHSRPGVVYEIVDIPPGCELNKLREFCNRLAQNHVPSLKTASDRLEEENGEDVVVGNSNENIAQEEKMELLLLIEETHSRNLSKYLSIKRRLHLEKDIFFN